MRASGRSVVLSVFALAIAMSAGAWWYHYQATQHTAEFWGPAAANLLVRGESVDAFNLAPAADPSAGESFPNWPPPFAALLEGGAVAYHDLTGAKGLIHLRHALTQDSSYDWDAKEINAAPTWALAFRFSDGDNAVWVLLSQELDYLAKPAADGKTLDVLLRQPPVGPVLREYFEDIGVLDAEAAAADESQSSPQ